MVLQLGAFAFVAISAMFAVLQVAHISHII